MKKILLFLVFTSFVFATDYYPMPPKTTPDCCPTGQYLKKGTIVYDSSPYNGVIQYAIQENLPAIHETYPSTCTATRFWRSLTSSNNSWKWKVIYNTCESIPDCNATQPGTQFNSDTQTCEEPACTLPDIPYPSDDPAASYSPWTPDPIECNGDFNTTLIKETARFECVEEYRCKATPRDDDEDGVPNADDPFPNDSTESQDTDGDGIGDNADTDDDNDGYSDEQEKNEHTDPTDPNNNGGTNGSGSTPDGGGDNPGGSSNTENNPVICPPGQVKCGDSCILFGVVCEEGTTDGSTKDNDCVPGFHPAADYATTFNCDPDTPDDTPPPNDCNLLASYAGFSYKTITQNQISCRLIQNANGGGNSYYLPNCDQGTVACYYGSPEPESNSSLPPETDSNTSLDISPIVNKLDEVQLEISSQTTDLSSRLDAINTNISKQSDKNLNALDSIRIGANQNTRDLENTINNLSNRLGGGLAGVNAELDAISDKLSDTGSVSFTALDGNSSHLSLDSTKTGEIYSTIDTVKKDLEEAQTLFQSAINEFGTFSDNLSLTFDSLVTDLESYKTMFDNKPTVDLPSGGSCNLSVVLWGKNVDYGTNICQFLNQISPLVVYILFITTQLTLIFIALRLFSL